MVNSKQVGEMGEDVACRYLRGRGYEILDRNYKKKSQGSFYFAEIDIIAEKQGVISFVEVKTAKKYGGDGKGNFDDVGPEQKIDYKKQRKIAKLAEVWLNKNKILLDSKWQIDAISVRLDFGIRMARVSYFENITSDWG